MSGSGHFLHFVMLILTGGMWLPVWVVCALICGSSRKKEELELLRKIAKGEK